MSRSGCRQDGTRRPRRLPAAGPPHEASCRRGPGCCRVRRDRGRAAALAHSLRCAAGGLLLAFAALLALPPQAQAQTVETLVSNTGQTAGDQNGLVGTIAGSNWLAGQGFTTGDNTDGYTLSSVQLYIKYFLITTQAKRNLSSRSGIGGVLSAT